MLSMVYIVGTLCLALGSWSYTNLPEKEFMWAGLILIALGTGGIKPCVSSFGGDQFKVPEQSKQLGQFFSIFYFVINLGSLASTIITPMLKEISCYGEKTCYVLAFGLPSFLMVLATVIFLCGYPLYTMKKAKGEVFLKFGECICHALRMKSKRPKEDEKKAHWLDYASDKYDEDLITAIKAVLDVMVVLLPAPFFWSLFDQQSSTWLYQAEKMNGRVGDYVILPEQIQAINPLLILVFVPMFEFGLYPLFGLCHIFKTPLQRMGLGLVSASVSFSISAGLEFIIRKQKEKTVHILWQIPQVVMMTVAEVLFSVQGLNFTFTQAPLELKSVVSAIWLLTTSLGNLLVSVISGTDLFSNAMYEFLFYSGLILLDFFFFLPLAIFYKTKEFHN